MRLQKTAAHLFHNYVMDSDLYNHHLKKRDIIGKIIVIVANLLNFLSQRN